MYICMYVRTYAYLHVSMRACIPKWNEEEQEKDSVCAKRKRMREDERGAGVRERNREYERDRRGCMQSLIIAFTCAYTHRDDDMRIHGEKLSESSFEPSCYRHQRVSLAHAIHRTISTQSVNLQPIQPRTQTNAYNGAEIHRPRTAA